MLIESDGLVATLRQRTDDDGGHVAAPGCEVQSVRFVKDNDEQAVFLEHGLRITGSRLVFSQLSAVLREQLCASLQRFGTMKE